MITLVAVIVLAGISYRQSTDQAADEQEAVIMAESEWTEDAEGSDEETVLSDAEDEGSEDVPEEPGADTEAGEDTIAPAGTDLTDASSADDSMRGTIVIEGATEEVTETMVLADSLSFSESDALRWPLQGDILINYSMDESVYFATLDQYKYNPALIIRGDVNAQVSAAAAGQVVGIETTAETGETVTMDIGSDYQLIYGQMKDLQVAEGDFVKAGDLIGYISEPTKYYSVEGSNLYFAMTKNGAPVNPLNYLE